MNDVNLVYERTHESMRALGLTTVDEIVDSYLESAVAKEQAHLEVIDHLLASEIAKRKFSAESTRMKLSGFPAQKTLETFDFDFQPSIDPAVIRELATLRFVNNNENVIFLGPPGVGKTHLAIALGIHAIKAGFSVYYTSAADMITRLRRAMGKDSFEREMRGYIRPRLLIVDEIGYLPIEKEGAGAFFRLINRRYEHGSTMFTSNKSYSEWGEVLGDSVVASAILDRILHHSTTVNIKGESFRLRTKRKGGAAQQEAREVSAKEK